MLSQPLLIWYEGAACAEWARTSSRGHHLPRVGLPAARQVYRLKLPRTFQWHGDEKVRALGQVRVGQIDIDRRQSSIVYARVARAYVCRVLSQVPVRYCQRGGRAASTLVMVGGDRGHDGDLCGGFFSFFFSFI